MKSKWTIASTQEFIAEARKVHGDTYDYSASGYSGMSKPLTVICSKHGAFLQTPQRHLSGLRCLSCAGKARKTREQFIADARAVHGDKYDYAGTEYKNNSTKLEVTCPEHGPFLVKPNNHTTNQSGCPSCAGMRRTTLEDFLTRARAAHGGKYDYSQAQYAGVDAPVTIICPEHGPFQQIAYDHTKGRGCIPCGVTKCADGNRRSLQEFIRRARLLHGDKYDYSRTVYVNSVTPAEIICPEHGSFWQVPQDHITKHGCAACAGLKPIAKSEFLQRATAAHGERYDYSQVDWSGQNQAVVIVCPVHGSFDQVPKSHMNGRGCRHCAREATSSKGERELADWLQGMGLRVLRNERETLGGLEMDVYLPDQQLAIEYNGAYWHHDGRMKHPRLHEHKARRAQALGIRLMTVWDFDWQVRQDFMRRHILHAIGRNEGKRIHARHCRVEAIDIVQARPFYDTHHIQGAPWRALHHLALLCGDDLVACMSFGQGNSRRGRVGPAEWELQRFATAAIVRGGASKLFAAFVRAQAPQAVWSFSDRQSFGGAMYLALGFECDGELPADYRVMHINSGRIWHKSAWQRRHIPDRLRELDVQDSFTPASDARTEREMQEAAGVVRIMDAGKIRWKWAQKNPV